MYHIGFQDERAYKMEEFFLGLRIRPINKKQNKFQYLLLDDDALQDLGVSQIRTGVVVGGGGGRHRSPLQTVYQKGRCESSAVDLAVGLSEWN